MTTVYIADTGVFVRCGGPSAFGTEDGQLWIASERVVTRAN